MPARHLVNPRALLALLAAALLASSGALVRAATDDAAGLAAPGQFIQLPPAEEKKSDAKPAEKKDKEKPFDEVVKDLEKIEGFYTFYRDPKENKVLLELSPDRLSKDFIISATLERGTGEKGLYSAIMMGSAVFQWRQVGQRVQLVQRNLRFRAQPGTPTSRGVERSFSDSVLASAKLASEPHPERKSVLIDLGDIFLGGDVFDLASGLKQAYQGGFKYDKSESSFALVKSFPQNSELGTVMHYQAVSELKESSVTVPDIRSFDVHFRYSLLGVPENDYQPRLADDRVGYFVDMFMDFTSDRPDTPYVRYINRWHLKKKDPKAAVSEPVEPLVFWLENTIPEEYRDAFREGVLLWNPAFEKIGFKNALAVKQQPDDADWDPADIRYNTIRWFASYDASFAIGPSNSDPYTGQLLDADIGFSEGILRLGARRRYQLYVNPVQAMNRVKEEPPALPVAFGDSTAHALCTYAAELTERMSFAYDVLAARPGWNEEKEKEFIRQYIVEVTAHEVGHTLGLRHNFRASIINGMDQLADQGRNRTVGLAASVMDYNPPVVALKGEKQGDYVPQVVGSYDQWAVEYGYKPLPGRNPEEELPELNKIASRVADPLVPYGTDYDAGYTPRALDPRNNHFDFAADPLAFYEHEFKVVDELWANMESKLLAEGDSYEILRRAFGYTWNPYFTASHVAMKYIGGLYHNRDHYGDPNGRLPYNPVPAAEQRRALNFLAEKIWAPNVFQPQADLLNKLQFPRLPDFQGSVYSTPRLDYPLHDAVLNAQGEVLNDLYHPIKLGRLLDSEMRFTNANDRFTLADMFVGVRRALWSELDAGQPSNSFRRNLQREHLKHLIELVAKPPAGTPEDAVTLARADLVELDKGIDRALTSGSLDHINRAHLEETRARIKQALEVQLQRSL